MHFSTAALHLLSFFLFLQFISDVKLMFKNCLDYNGETSSKTYFARIFSDHNHPVKSSKAPVIFPHSGWSTFNVSEVIVTGQ